MSRPLRIAEPGLWHHVMNRGRGSNEIFLDDEDRQAFLDIVAAVSTRWSVRTCAACLMDTHYHLLVWDENGHLSRAMRHIDGVYTQRFNRVHGVDGSLMRGRFRSRAVQRERYLFEVVRYVHANPVRAGLVSRAGDYPWSSHRHYLARSAPPWLHTALLKEQFSGRESFARWLDRFVHEPVDAAIDHAVSGHEWAPALGDATFLAAMRENVRQDARRSSGAVPEGRRLAMVTVDEVLESACTVFRVERDQLVRGRRGRANVPRLLALLMCRDHSSTDSRALGEVFGVKPGTVSVLALKARALRRDQPAVRASWKRLAKALSVQE